MKKCFKCSLVKPLNQYYKHAHMLDGHLNKCKLCTKIDVASNQTNYDLTEKGVIRVIYKTQKRNSKIRNMPPPVYTKGQLSDWLYQHGFKKLYDDWVRSGHQKNKKPSVDRIDSLKGYNFNNIELVTWETNMARSALDTRQGVGSNGKKCKPVICMDSNRNVIASFVSRASACRFALRSIDTWLNNGRMDKCGLYWSYVDK